MSPLNPRSTSPPISARGKTGIAAAIESFPLILNDILASFLISCFCFARFRHSIDEPDHPHERLGNAPVPRSRSGLGIDQVSHYAALVSALSPGHFPARLARGERRLKPLCPAMHRP